jgi:hypothetical protein
LLTTAAEEYISMNVRLSKENEKGNLRRFGLNLISNSVCTLA